MSKHKTISQQIAAKCNAIQRRANQVYRLRADASSATNNADLYQRDLINMLLELDALRAKQAKGER